MKRKSRKGKGSDVNQIPMMKVMKVLFVFVCLGCMISFSMFMIKFAKVAKENREVLAQIEAQEEESQYLLAKIEEADSPEFVESDARKAGMGYDDEIVFIDKNAGNFENSGD